MPHLGFKTRISTNNSQKELFGLYSRAAKRAWNYALGLCYLHQETLPEGEKWKLAFINEYDKYFNQGKYPLGFTRGTKTGQLIGTGEHVWCNGTPASITQYAIKYDLKEAWTRCFKKLGKRPRFKSKSSPNSFKMSNIDFRSTSISTERTHIVHKKFGSIRLGANVPQKYIQYGKLMSVTFSESGSEWYVSFCFDVPDEVYYNISTERHMMVGVDMGVAEYATVYDAESNEAWHEDYPKENLAQIEQKVRKLQRKQSKKERGSSNSKKMLKKIAKLKAKQARVRSDAAHKLSKKLSTQSHTIVLEDLKVSNMTRSASGTIEEPGKNVAQKRGLNREILNMGFHSFKVLLQYKTDRYGSVLAVVDPKYTSQTCSECGNVDKNNRKSQSMFVCTACGHTDNADKNAAKNILMRHVNKKEIVE